MLARRDDDPVGEFLLRLGPHARWLDRGDVAREPVDAPIQTRLVNNVTQHPVDRISGLITPARPRVDRHDATFPLSAKNVARMQILFR